VSEETSIAAYWSDGMNEAGLADWARRLRAAAGENGFARPRFSVAEIFAARGTVLEILRLHAQIPLLVGCSGGGLVANSEEIEGAGGLVLALYSLPGANLKGIRFTQEQVDSAEGEDYWPVETGVAKSKVNGWLAFANPFNLDGEKWLRSWNQNYSGIPVYGGLASGNFQEQTAQVYLDGEVFDDGGVAIAVGGEVTLAGVISQGCTPIGEAWTLTRVEQNLIRNIANRPAYAVLAETVQQLSPEDQRKVQGNLHIGLVVNEYLDEFHRGDFSCVICSAAIPIPACSPSAPCRAWVRPSNFSGAMRRQSEDLNELLAAKKRGWTRRKFTAAACSAATVAAKIFSAAPAMIPSWCRRISGRRASPDFSATAKSVPSATRIFCTVSPLRWRYL
jgi:hypothetical protein